MAISYNSGTGFLEVSGDETWQTLNTFAVAGGYAVLDSAISLRMSKPVKILDAASLTVTGRVLSADGAILPSADNGPAIRANNSANRGKLILRSGAVVCLSGPGNAYSELFPTPDYQDSEIISSHAYTSFANLGGSGAAIANTRWQCAGLYGLDQHWSVSPGAAITGLAIATINSGYLLLRSAADSSKLTLGAGISLGGYGTGAAEVTSGHYSMRSSSKTVVVHRGSLSLFFYDFADLSGVRQWDLSYASAGNQAPTPAEAGRICCAWLFNPLFVAGSGSATAGVSWRVAAAAGAPFSSVQSGLSSASGRTTSAGITWGYYPAQQRTFAPPSGAYVVKSQTPAATAAPVTAQVITGFDVDIRKYGYYPSTAYVTGDTDYTDTVLLTADAGCVLTEAQAAALTGISYSGNTITITSSKTIDDVYCYLQWWYAQPAQMSSRQSLTSAAPNYNIGSRDVVVGAGAVLSAGAAFATLSTTGVVSGAGEMTAGYADANSDSYLAFSQIDSWIVYSDPARTAQVGAGTGSQLFRFVYAAGVTRYLKCISGSTEFAMVATATAPGATVVSLSTQALLTTLQAQVSSVKADTGLIKALVL